MSNREQERPRRPGELAMPSGLGNPFGLGDGDSRPVTVEHGVYAEDLPVAGRTIGEIRRLVASRYDIDPRADAFVDGRPATADVTLSPGQRLRFMHVAGEKGQRGGLQELRDRMGSLFADPPLRLRRRIPEPPTVDITGDHAGVAAPGGVRTTMKLDALLDRLSGSRYDERLLRGAVLPDGVKLTRARNGHVVLVHQTPPAVHRLRWIAADSPVRHGEGTTYRWVSLALPYVIVVAVFEPLRPGRVRLSKFNECFFSNRPLREPGDPLCYPALLNCSKMEGRDRPLAWICSQHLKRRRSKPGTSATGYLRDGLADILHCLLETGFNYSSEEHEMSSWFSESAGIDPRISSVERWEAASRADPTFVLDVQWIQTGKSVGAIAERCLDLTAGPRRTACTSYDLARILQAHGRAEPSPGVSNDA